MNDPSADRPSRGQGRSVTIGVVARRAGVSPMTVSRVVNGSAGVRDQTRSKVLEAIEALGYEPNAAARSLAGSGGARIGLLYSNPSASYLGEFLLGALIGARRVGAQLLMERCDGPFSEDEARAVARMIAGGVSGVLLPPPHGESHAAFDAMRDAGVAVVSAATGYARPDLSSVRIDDHAAAGDMTRHLLELGHRRIGFIMGATDQTSSAERLRGFQDAMKAAGAEAFVEAGDFTYRGGFEAAERLLALDPRPTAIFASNDDMAAATVGVAHRLRLDVPGEVSVVGFDDTPIARNIWPELTTVRQPIAEMAEAAIDRLALEMRDGAPEMRADHIVPHILIARDSTGPA